MSSSTNSTPRVPAWKRLGLKLKQQPAEAGNPPLAAASPYKKARTGDAASVAPTLKRQKSVTFADDTKPGLTPTAERNGVKTPSKKKAGKASGPKKQKKPQPEADFKPALAYLKAWKTSRDSWKFNKNYQTLLVKRVFLPGAIPSEDIETFYEYIRDLKGYTRQRLRELAMEVRKEDDAARGKEGFPEGTADTDSKQTEYDALIEGFRKLATGTGSKRKRFDEVEFVSRNLDSAVTQRVVKRMRAELILEDLSDGEESTDSDAATATTTTTASSKTTAPSEPAQNVARMDEPLPLPKLENGTQLRVRRRKARVMADDTSSDESSSDSDSDSDSDSASDGSGSDSGSDSSSSDEDGGDDDDDSSSSDSSDSSDEESEGESSEDSSDSDDEPPSKVKKSKAR
ncbi:hypothetical protein ACRALDRAFT_2040380 [Sodiomyces alcalophilus JCM 7366]|uniref:uncharacterized protein n=1 Tax=Sodiomyces alcalophilus JCM 7366 TaxID=591952 RepID=UPI0039B59680